MVVCVCIHIYVYIYIYLYIYVHKFSLKLEIFVEKYENIENVRRKRRRSPLAREKPHYHLGIFTFLHGHTYLDSSSGTKICIFMPYFFLI
jgi:hypothetical protein